jgi:hypothetical protein
MELFFLRDIHGAHSVYSDSVFFQWDRYNFGLDTHFYSHNAMLETMGKPKRKYGFLFESESVTPDDYLIFKRYHGLENEFNLIFTYSDKILQTVKNARYLPYCIKPWYSCPCPHQYQKKIKNVSIIASSKTWLPLHKFRNTVAMQCKTQTLCDVYGTFDGGRYCTIEEPFTDYRFSIVIENEITPYGFTEKITNCFAAMTIPVYLGATRIGKLFNPDGIVDFNINDDIEKVIKKCTKEFYEERIPAIIDNYNAVNIGMSSEDIMYKQYIQNDSGQLTPEELFKNFVP